MNFASFKNESGDCVFGLRIRVPDGELRQLFYSPPGYVGVLLLSEVLKLTLHAAGHTTATVGLVGELPNCSGVLRLADPDSGLKVVREVLHRYGLADCSEFSLADAVEGYWRPLQPKSSDQFAEDECLRQTEHFKALVQKFSLTPE